MDKQEQKRLLIRAKARENILKMAYPPRPGENALPTNELVRRGSLGRYSKITKTEKLNRKLRKKA